MGDAVLNIGGDSAGGQKAIDALRKEVNKLKEEQRGLVEAGKGAMGQFDQGAQRAKKSHRDLGDELGRIKREHGGLFGAMGSDLKSLATHAFAAIVGIEGLKKAFEDARKEERETMQATVDLAGAQREFLGNYITGGGELSAEQATKRLAGISEATGVSAKDLSLRASGVFSARGLTPEPVAWRVVEESARFAPGDPAKGRAIAIGTMDLLEAGRSQNVEGMMGTMAWTMGKAHIQDWQKIAENAAPAIANVMRTGGTAPQAAALFATVTKGLKDWTGQMSGTVTAQVARQLAELMPEKDTPVWHTDPATGMTFKTRVQKGIGTSSYRERLERLWASRDEGAVDRMLNADALAAQFRGKEKSKLMVRDLLLGKGIEAEALRGMWAETDQKMGTEAGQAGYYRDVQAKIGEAPTLQIAGADRRFKTGIEGLRTETARGQRRAVADVYSAENLDAIYKATAPDVPGVGPPLNYVGRWGAWAEYNVRVPFQGRGAAFESGARYLANKLENQGAEGKEVAAALRALIGELRNNSRDQTAALKESLDALRGMRTATEEGNRKRSAQGAGQVNQHSE